MLDHDVLTMPQEEATAVGIHHDVDGPTVLASLRDAYQGQGYEAGYRRAVADIVGSLVLL